MGLPDKVTVHPIVLLSVVDHFNRVALDTRRRVVGVLLGSVSGGHVDVLNSFAVPFEEDERDPSIWFLDHDYLETMFSMFRKVAAKERIIGWYSTGPKIRANDLAIHELMRKYCPNPVLTVVDVSPKDVEIPTEAYCSIDESRGDGSPPRKVFAHVASEIGALEAEEIGVEHLLRDVKDAEAPGSLAARLNARLASVRGLSQRLREIRSYLESVAEGTLPLNQEVLTMMQEAMLLVGRTVNSGAEVTEAFAVKTNDMMLGVYIGSVVRAIAALHDLINNKIALGEAEAAGDEEAENREKEKEKAKEGKDKAKSAKGKDTA